MKTRLLLLLLLLLLFALPPIAWATDLRGRVDGRNPATGTKPLGGVLIGLFSVGPNNSYTLVRQASTGPDGVYYLRGIAPGKYVLQVAGVNYPVAVGAGPNQDIPVILK
jgi:hypothetical protein